MNDTFKLVLTALDTLLNSRLEWNTFGQLVGLICKLGHLGQRGNAELAALIVQIQMLDTESDVVPTSVRLEWKQQYDDAHEELQRMRDPFIEHKGAGQ